MNRTEQGSSQPRPDERSDVGKDVPGQQPTEQVPTKGPTGTSGTDKPRPQGGEPTGTNVDPDGQQKRY